MLRAAALVAAVLGGLAWTARWAVDRFLGEPGWATSAHWAGLVLLGVAVAVVGAGLVSSSAAWLRVVVGVAAPLLVWSVYSVIRGDGDGTGLDGLLGILTLGTVVAVVVTGRRSNGPSRPQRSHGAHSAR